MHATIRKTSALIAKDAADTFKNPTMLVSVLMPIAFMVLYRFMFARMGVPSSAGTDAAGDYLAYLLSMSAILSISMSGTMMVLYGLAEEKEKHTLRTLMLANVGAGQIMASKLAVAGAMIVVVEAVCFAVVGAPLGLLPLFLVIGVLGAVPILLISALLGLAARDQMTAGVYAVPVLLAALAPMFAMLDDGIARIVAWLPTGGTDQLVRLLADGGLLTGDAIRPLAVTLAWIAAGALAFTLLFKRLARDN